MGQPSVENTAEHYEVVVIGAGQAGLAMGYFLSRQKRRFLIVERAGSVGSAWRERWDSLTLFTSRRYDSLPGLDFPGDAAGYPNRDEVIGTWRSTPAASSYRSASTPTFGGWVRASLAETSLTPIEERWTADEVVVATGPFQQPFVQTSPRNSHPRSTKVTASSTEGRPKCRRNDPRRRGRKHRFPDRGRTVLDHDRVVLAVGSRQMPLPQRVLGRDLFWWLTKSRVINKTVESRLGSRMQHRDTLIGSSPRRLSRHGGTLKPRVVEAQGKTVRFEDGGELNVDAVIWATGYRPDYSVDVPLIDAESGVRSMWGDRASGLCTSSGCTGSGREAPRDRLGEGRRRVHRPADRELRAEVGVRVRRR